MNISIRYCSNIDIASWLINNIIKDIIQDVIISINSYKIELCFIL